MAFKKNFDRFFRFCHLKESLIFGMKIQLANVKMRHFWVIFAPCGVALLRSHKPTGVIKTLWLQRGRSSERSAEAL